MKDGAQHFSRLDAKRREQTPQALARLVVVTLFAGLWSVLWLARIPMPLPFLIVLLIEILFFLAYWRAVFFLPTVRAVTAAQYVMLGAEILFHTTMVYFLGSLSWLGAFAYVFGLIFTNAFLDLRRGMIYTAGACAAFSTLILLEATGTIPHYVYLDQGALRYTDPQFVVTTLVGAVGVFVSICLWSSWVGHQLRRERDTAVRAQDDLLHARVELLRVNEELEERVHARTADLETANAALSESQQQLRLVLETCPDLISIQEPDGRYRFANAAHAAVLGYAPEELVGRSPNDLIHADDLETVQEQFRRSFASGDPAEVVARLRHADGRWVTLEANGRVLIDGSGEISGIVVVSRDITERKRAEEALRESEATLKATIESTADGILVIHPERRIAYANRRFIEMWRLPKELAVAGNDSNELVSYVLDQLEDPDRFVASVEQMRWTQGERLDTVVCKDGRIFERYRRAMLKDGEIVGRVISLRDVTERKRAEEALRESEAILKATIESTADGILVVNSGGQVVYANERFAEMWRIPQTLLETHADDKLLGFVLDQVRDPEAFIAKVRELYQSSLQSLDDLSFKDDRVFERYSRPLMLGGEVAGRVWSFRDITERKRAEEALRESARRDALTNLLNHVAITDELRGLIAEGGEGVSHAVAMVDIDGLKSVNDTYGHPVGDVVLLAVAGALARNNAVVGRYGGDEFVAILRDTDRAAAERYRDAVLEALTDANVTDPETGAHVPVVASIGLAIYPEEAATIDGLISLSDNAMYASRRQRPFGHTNIDVVGELAPLLTAPGDLNDKLRLVAHRLSAGTGFDAVDFSLFAPTPGAPLAQSTFARVPEELVETWTRDERTSAPTTNPERHPIHLLFERTLRPIIIDDPWNNALLLERQRAILKAAGLRSVLVAPMIWQDQAIGSLGVASRREHAFGPRDAQFLAAAATHVTTIVRIATLVEELRSTSEHLADARDETVMLLAAAAEARDHVTGLHLQNVRALTEALARELGHSEAKAREMGLAAVLHDIGKIRVPDAVLTHSSRLSDDAWELMKQHTVWGADFLAGQPGFELAAAIARAHHEHWDGSGYPLGLAGEAIPEPAAIVSLADAFDAMTSDRPYRQRRSAALAIEEIAACSGKQFSPPVVEALLRLYQREALPLPSQAPPRAA